MITLKKLPVRVPALPALLALLALSGCPGTGSDTNPSSRSVSIERNGAVLALSWEAAPGAEGYRLYIAENHDDTQNVQPLELVEPVYVVTATNSGSAYYFRVKALINGVEAEDWWATGKTTMPVAAPSNIILSRTYTSIYVFWDAVNGASSYEVYYSRINKSENAEKWTGSIDGASTEITDLKNNVSYYVWVRALGQNGPSPFSEVRNATTGPPKKPAVPDIAWTIRMKNAVGAIWAPAENAVSYDFCYGTGTDPAIGTIVTVRDTICLVENLPRNVNYRIWVRGKNVQYVSDWTEVCEAKTGQGFPEHIEGTYFARSPADIRGGLPYYMDGYQVGKVRDMYRDFPFNKKKFTDPKYSVGLPAHLVNMGITRELPSGASYDDDDQYVLYHFEGFMGIVRAVLEKPSRATPVVNYTILELFKNDRPAWNFTTVKFSYDRTSDAFLRGVNEYALVETELTPAILKEVGGVDWDHQIAYPCIRLGYTGSGKGVGGVDKDADFHPELLPPNFFDLSGDLWDLVNW
jgi:hypothetical protein